MKTFSQFVAEINETKLDFASAARSFPGVKPSDDTKEKSKKGTYAKDVDDEDDEDDKAEKSTEKRGRGRPVGSTSGTHGSGKKSSGIYGNHSFSLPSFSNN